MANACIICSQKLNQFLDETLQNKLGMFNDRLLMSTVVKMP